MKLLFQKYLRLPPILKYGAILLLAACVWFGWTHVFHRSSNQQQYQTAAVTRDTLVVSVSVSGQVSGANSAEVTTQASGVVKTVYVKDGDMVKAGDKIATLDLDLTGQQRAKQAYASYQSAQNSVESAQANLYSSQSTLFSQWQSYMDKAQNSTYQNSDDSPNTSNRQLTDFTTTQDDWLAAEAKYKVQQKAISQAETSLSASWYSYQQSSPTIVAPISGTLTGFSLQPGTVITAQTNSSGGSSSQRIANVKTDAPPTISLNLTQIDAPKVKSGDKATVTFDAFPDKTYTGEVVSVDTIGSQTSGVTTYPAIVKLDTTVDGLLPNMSANANIITATKSDALLVPSTAIQTQNNETVLRVIKNGQVTNVTVTTGLASDSQTEIVSGVNEGDTIVTSVTNAATTSTQNGQSTSPFSPFGRSGGNRMLFQGGH